MAATAELAIPEMQRGDVRVLVRDAKLPGMDRVERCRTLMAMIAIAAGAVTWITKVFQPFQLIAEIRRYWPQQRSLATERLPTPLIAIANLDDSILQIVRQRMADPAFGVAEWSDAAHLSDQQLRRKLTDRSELSPIVWL